MTATSQDDLLFTMANWVHELTKWKVFFTLTFRYEASSWSAERVLRRFMKASLPTVSYFYAIERNPSRDGHHVHGIWDSAEAPRKATHRAWLERYGRNRIEPVRGYSDVVNYCSKYVVKEAAWWNFYLTPKARTEHTGGMVCQVEQQLFPPSPCGNEHTLQLG